MMRLKQNDQFAGLMILLTPWISYSNFFSNPDMKVVISHASKPWSKSVSEKFIQSILLPVFVIN